MLRVDWAFVACNVLSIIHLFISKREGSVSFIKLEKNNKQIIKINNNIIEKSNSQDIKIEKKNGQDLLDYYGY